MIIFGLNLCFLTPKLLKVTVKDILKQITVGIVPYIKEELLKGIKDVQYCFKFDETTKPH